MEKVSDSNPAPDPDSILISDENIEKINPHSTSREKSMSMSNLLRRKNSNQSNKSKYKTKSNESGLSGASSDQSQSGDGRESILAEDATTCDRLLHRDRLLTILIILGVLLGLGLGFWLKLTKPSNFWTHRKTMYLQFPGELFFRSLIAMKVPVAVSSLIASVGSVNLQICRYILLRGILCILGMIFIGSFLGALAAFPLHTKWLAVITPESFHKLDFCKPHELFEPELCNFPDISNDGIQIDPRCTTDLEVFMNLLRAIFPQNFVQAIKEQEIVATNVNSPIRLDPGTEGNYKSCVEYIYRRNKNEEKRSLHDFNVAQNWVKETNIIGLLMMSLCIGLCTLWVGKPARDFLNFFISVSEITLKMASWVLWMAPIGICFHTAGNVVSNENPFTFHVSLKNFVLIALLGLLFQTFIFLPGLYWLLLRKSPLKFYISLSPVMAVAFGSSYGSSTIPVAIKSLEEVANLDPRVVRLLVPIMANINMSGNALFLACAFSFICLSHEVPMSFPLTIYIVLISSLITIVAPNAIPDYGILQMFMVLTFSNLQAELALDIVPTLWILNRAAAAANIASSCVGVAIINHWCKKKLRKLFSHHMYQKDKVEKDMDLQNKIQKWSQAYESEPTND